MRIFGKVTGFILRLGLLSKLTGIRRCLIQGYGLAALALLIGVTDAVADYVDVRVSSPV